MDLVVHPLGLPVTLPLAAGLVCLLLPRRLAGARPLISLLACVITAMLCWQLFKTVRPLDPAAGEAWSYGGGPLLQLRLDHLGSFVLLAISVMSLLITMYSIGSMKGAGRLREYYSYLLWTMGLSCGAVLANDWLLLLVFWGLLGLTLYVMVGMGGQGAAAAAKKGFIIIGGSDCLLMLGVALLWVLRRTTRLDAAPIPFGGELSYAAFLCLAAAAFAKAGAMPVHTWVPDCGERAPVPVAAFLPASLDKLLGIYLLVRVTRDAFVMDFLSNGFLMFAGAGTVVCAVMMALVQHDLKRLLSYHAVSQVGYMILGIGSGTLVGMAGALFHMLNNAVYKCCLFLCAGNVQREAGTTDLDKLGGLAHAMPLTFGSCFVAALAISGVPPLNGFASKWMVYQGIVASGREGGQLWPVWLAAAMLGSALTLASFVKVLHAVYLRRPATALRRRYPRDPGLAMVLPPLFLAALCVLFGVGAHRLPLPAMIVPAVGFAGRLPYPGVWYAGGATVMLLAAYGFGLLLYRCSSARRPRTTPAFVGGELLDRTHIAGEQPGEERDVEVTGIGFYRTVEEWWALRPIYAAARRKAFDLYETGAAAVFYLVGLLRAAHSGRLPTYLTWFLAGFLGVLWLLVFGAEWL